MNFQVTERIFDGLKVIDCASFIAGPAAATIMSDFGAEVVKIEPPGMGDPYRRRAVPNPKNPLNPGFLFDTKQAEPRARSAHRARARGALSARQGSRRLHHQLPAPGPRPARYHV